MLQQIIYSIDVHSQIIALEDICILGDCSAASDAATKLSFTEAIKNVITYLITDEGALFQAILAPFQLIAGAGVLFSLIPVIKAVSRDSFNIDYERIILLFLMICLFINDGALGKAVAFANYAFIKGTNTYISKGLESVAFVTDATKNLKNDTTAVGKINNKLKDCLALSQTTIDKATGSAIPNPAFTQCDSELRGLISSAQIKNPDAATAFATALSRGDFNGMANGINVAVSSFPGWLSQQVGNAAMAVPKAILDGWKVAVAAIADVALVVSILFFPITLAFSFLNTAPLQVWFSSLWAVGFFQFALTILTGAFTIINAKLGANFPLFTMELLAAIFAPAVAGVMATGGGIGVFKLVNRGMEASIGVLGRTLQLIRG